MSRFSALAGDGGITCGTVLNWLELDNRGNRLIVTDDSTDINTPAVAAAYATKRYAKQASDEISFEVRFEIFYNNISEIFQFISVKQIEYLRNLFYKNYSYYCLNVGNSMYV